LECTKKHISAFAGVYAYNAAIASTYVDLDRLKNDAVHIRGFRKGQVKTWNEILQQANLKAADEQSKKRALDREIQDLS
jgi:hypothetical protein